MGIRERPIHMRAECISTLIFVPPKPTHAPNAPSPPSGPIRSLFQIRASKDVMRSPPPIVEALPHPMRLNTNANQDIDPRPPPVLHPIPPKRINLVLHPSQEQRRDAISWREFVRAGGEQLLGSARSQVMSSKIHAHGCNLPGPRSLAVCFRPLCS